MALTATPELDDALEALVVAAGVFRDLAGMEPDAALTIRTRPIRGHSSDLVVLDEPHFY